MTICEVSSSASGEKPEPDQRGVDLPQRLRFPGLEQETASAELHELLVRTARREAHRRAVGWGMSGPEVDDMADQAAADAMVAVLGKLHTFRGESRFTTWAYKFVIFEVAGKFNRHHWRRGESALKDSEWDELPARFGMQPEDEAEWHDLMAALHAAVAHDLSERQRVAFVAIVIHGTPLDAFSAEMGTSRNAVYKVLFDARRKLRTVLAAQGYLSEGQRNAEREEGGDDGLGGTRSAARH